MTLKNVFFTLSDRYCDAEIVMLKRANLEKLCLNFKKLKITKQLNCSDDFWKQFGI